MIKKKFINKTRSVKQIKFGTCKITWYKKDQICDKNTLSTTQSLPVWAPWCSTWWQSCSGRPRPSPTPRSSTSPPPGSSAGRPSKPPPPTRAAPSWVEPDGCASSTDPVEVDIPEVEVDIQVNSIGSADQLVVAPGLHQIIEEN